MHHLGLCSASTIPQSMIPGVQFTFIVHTESPAGPQWSQHISKQTTQSAKPREWATAAHIHTYRLAVDRQSPLEQRNRVFVHTRTLARTWEHHSGDDRGGLGTGKSLRTETACGLEVFTTKGISASLACAVRIALA